MKPYRVDLHTFDELRDEARWSASRFHAQANRYIGTSNLANYLRDMGAVFTRNGQTLDLTQLVEVTETREQIIAETREKVAAEIEALVPLWEARLNSMKLPPSAAHAVAVKITTLERAAEMARGGK